MPNGTYGGVRGRKTKVGRKLLRFPPTRLRRLLSLTESNLFLNYNGLSILGNSGNFQNEFIFRN